MAAPPLRKRRAGHPAFGSASELMAYALAQPQAHALGDFLCGIGTEHLADVPH
jgi:hypothetical protein